MARTPVMVHTPDLQKAVSTTITLSNTRIKILQNAKHSALEISIACRLNMGLPIQQMVYINQEIASSGIVSKKKTVMDHITT